MGPAEESLISSLLERAGKRTYGPQMPGFATAGIKEEVKECSVLWSLRKATLFLCTSHLLPPTPSL